MNRHRALPGKPTLVRRHVFTLIECVEDFRFSIPDFRFPNDQASASATATQWHGSAQSKIQNRKSKISRAWRGGAFTLVELLTVIAIIGILAALSFAGFSQVRRMADQAKCAANLRGLATAGLLWIHDHKGNMPDAMFWRYPGSHDGSFLPYLDYTDGQSATSATPTRMSCPASFKDVGPNPDWNRGYSINIYACRTENNQWPPVSPFSRHATNVQQIAQPSVMAFLMDANFFADGTAERKVSNATVVDSSSLWKQRGAAGFYAGHGGKANVAFLDGHLRAVDPLKNFPTGTADEKRLHPFWGSLR